MKNLKTLQNFKALYIWRNGYNMRFYQLPTSRILKDSAFINNNNIIYKGEDIAQALTSWGCACSFLLVDTAPQVLTYHFNLDHLLNINKIKRLLLPLSALLGCKVEQAESQKGAHFALIVQRIKKNLIIFKSILLNRQYNEQKSPFCACLGFDSVNNPVYLDIDKMPHLLIAGATGSGKSTALNTLICSLLFRATPNKLKLLMIDTKRVELSAYEKIPHLYAPIAKDGQSALILIKQLNNIMRERLEIMEQNKVNNIILLNYPRIFLIIDEMADLIIMKKEEVEPLLVNIAQLGRAAGIHLILATQRPTVNVITGLLKANIACRLALQVASMRDSMTILDHKGAEALTGQGDALLKKPDNVKENRLQVAYISREDVASVCKWWVNNGIIEE